MSTFNTFLLLGFVTIRLFNQIWYIAWAIEKSVYNTQRDTITIGIKGWRMVLNGGIIIFFPDCESQLLRSSDSQSAN